MFRAIIFDFDGVITDSEPVHLKMFQKVLSEKGISLGVEEYYEKYLGMDDKGCFSTLLQSRGMDADTGLVQSLIHKKTTYLMEYIKNDLFIYPGVVDFIEKARKRFNLAIASGALRHEIEFVLQRAGIRSAFGVIVSAEDVREGKPAPECFLKALERLNETDMITRLTKDDEDPLSLRERDRPAPSTLLRAGLSEVEGVRVGLFSDENERERMNEIPGTPYLIQRELSMVSPEFRPGECLVIEDSIAGIEAAHAAGMKCMAVTNTYGRERLTMADLVVKSLEEINVDALDNLINKF